MSCGFAEPWRELLPRRCDSLIIAAAPFFSLPSASAHSDCDLTPVLLTLLLSLVAPPQAPSPSPRQAHGTSFKAG